MGKKAFIFAFLAIPVGLAIGFFELGLGLAMHGLIVFYEIVPGDGLKLVVSDAIGLDPRTTFILMAISVAAIRYAAFLLPLVAAEAFNQYARGHLLNRSLGSGNSESTVFSNDVTHLTSNLIPHSIGAIMVGVQLLSAIFMSFILVLGMLKISIHMTALALGLGVLASLLLSPAPYFLRKIARDMHAQLTSFTHRLMKDVQHLYFLKILGNDAEEHRILTRVSDDIYFKYSKYSVINGMVTVFPFLLGILFVIVIIEVNIDYELIGISSLLPFIYFLHRFASSATQVSQSTGSLIKGVPFLQEFFSFIQRSSDVAPRQLSISTDDAVESEIFPLTVSKLAIGRSLVLISDISFSVSAGETLLITGESGCGKTTLLMSLVGLVPPIDGSVKWGNNELTGATSIALRKKVSFAGPDPYLFSGTILENLLFGIEETDLADQEIETALWCASADFVHRREAGVDSALGEDGDGLSAGQKQRLSIARAVLRRPAVFLFDETTSNIDEKTEAVIMSRLRQNFPDAVIIAISHRASMKSYATTHVAL